MIDIDRRYGPVSGRVWGLAVNFVANAAALFGMVGFIEDGRRMGLMLAGVAVTVLCLVVLAIPDR